jgi:Lrp/AsnC family transcriptional regulator for asnA, asnC and gidA
MDNTDKKLISILQKDGRTSLSEIGKHLGMSHVAVSKRLHKLQENDLIQVTAGVNADQLGIKVLFMGLETENIKIADNIMKKYENCPRLISLAPVTGRYNLFAVLVAEDTVSLESILGTCSMRAEEGVRRSETWFGNAPFFPKYLLVNLAPGKTKETKSPCGQDCNKCRRYTVGKCVACPTSTVYKGKLWASPKTKSKRRRRKKSKT